LANALAGRPDTGSAHVLFAAILLLVTGCFNMIQASPRSGMGG
jgi:hypothetical protein